MLKHIRHIILIVALLLSLMGNVARLGVCPCGDDFLGFFVGECHCNICEESTSECLDCLHPSALHGLMPGAAEVSASFEGHVDIGLPPCPNKMLEGSGPLLLLPELALPKLPLAAVVLPEWMDWPASILFPSQESLREIPPPPLLERGGVHYVGYMRPLRA